MHRTVSRRSFIAQLFCTAAIAGAASAVHGQPSPVCENEELLKALRILHRACGPLGCDLTTLNTLDDPRYRDALFAAFSNKDLNPVHIFYPDNVSDLTCCFDWATKKKSQLGTFTYWNLKASTVYVMGNASTTGSDRQNTALSEQRMDGVRKYLRDDLAIACHDFRGAFMSNRVMQLDDRDAKFLQIAELDYRNSPLVLNQAVHVFAVPCEKAGL